MTIDAIMIEGKVPLGEQVRYLEIHMCFGGVRTWQVMLLGVYYIENALVESSPWN